MAKPAVLLKAAIPMAKKSKLETRRSVATNPLLRLPPEEQEEILFKGIAQRVSAARVEEELTQEEMHKRFQYFGGSTTRASLSHVETARIQAPLSTLWRLAYALNRTPEYIVFGVENQAPKEVLPDPETLGFVIAPEVEFGAEVTDRRETRKWGLPTDWLRTELGVSDPSSLVVFKVTVDSEGVEYGDRIIIDTSPGARMPSPPGRFLIWESGALVGQVMIIPGSGSGRSKPMAKVTGVLGTFERPVDQLRIIGRVRGLWRRA